MVSKQLETQNDRPVWLYFSGYSHHSRFRVAKTTTQPPFKIALGELQKVCSRAQVPCSNAIPCQISRIVFTVSPSCPPPYTEPLNLQFLLWRFAPSPPHHLISPIITSPPNCATRSIARLSASHSHGCLVKSTRAESTLIAG